MATKTIKIKVDKNGAQRSLDAVNKQLGNVGLKAEFGASSLSGMAGKATMAAGAVAAVGAAAVLTTKKMLDLAAASAQAVNQMSRSAGLAKLSTDEFQALAYASSTVGISQEKLGDILKDVNDKLGDFIATGGGEFKDVFETALKPMGITIDQLKEMSSSEVLIAVQQGMEATGASGKEVTFVLEAIANDAALLEPLLKDNAKGLKGLSKEARDMGLIIPPEQVAAAKEFDKQYKQLIARFDTFKNLIGLALIPVMEDVVEWLAEAAHWADQFFGITAQGQVKKYADEIVDLEAKIERLSKSRSSQREGSIVYKQLEETKKKLAEVIELKKEADEVAESQLKPFSYEGRDGVTPNSITPTAVSGSGVTDETIARQLELIQRLNDSEAMQIENWRFDEFEKLAAYHEQKLISEEEFAAAMLEINKKANADQDKLTKDKEEKEKATRIKAKKDEQAQLVNLAYQTNTALDNVAKMAEGRSKTLNAVAQGAATMQATMNMYLAASQAMADWGSMNPIQKAANVTMILGMGANLISGITGASSRQSGGYMEANTPYQVGGGAHTSDPELYSSGGKSYIVDSQAGMMKRVSGSTSGSAAPQVSLNINNLGEPMNLVQTGQSLDEDGVLNLIYENVPNILRNESANPDSQFNQGRQANESINWSYK